MSLIGTDLPFEAPPDARWTLEQLHVGVAFAEGYSALVVDGIDTAEPFGRPTVLALTSGNFRLLNDFDRLSAPLQGLPAGTVPDETVICYLEHGGRTIGRRRNDDGRRVVALLYEHIDPLSFEEAVEARTQALLGSPAGRKVITRWWNVHHAVADTPVTSRALPTVTGPDDVAGIQPWMVYAAITGAASVWMRAGTVLGKAADRFIEFSTMALPLDPASGDLEFITPIAFLQDLMVQHGKLTFTPIRDAVGMPASALREVTDVSHFPVSQETHPFLGPTADAFVLQLIPVFDTETTCRPVHKGRRRTFASNNGTAAAYVFPLEYTNPTPERYPDAVGASNMSPSFIRLAEAAEESGIEGLDCTDSARGPGNPSGADTFEPTQEATIVIGSVEYETLDFIQLRNWSDEAVDKNDSRNYQYDYTTIRPPAMVTSVVIHDTTNNTADGRNHIEEKRAWGRSVYTGLQAHFLVHRNGHISQVADLLERIGHADSHSETSIGIEVANDVMFQLRRGSTQEPTTDGADDQFHADVRWIGWRGEQEPRFVGKVRIPPRECLEELWGLVRWLTSGGQPLPVPLIFPQLDPRYWPADKLARLPANFYGEDGGAGTLFRSYLDVWRELGLPHADGAEDDTPTGGARYWHVQLRNDHNQVIRPAFPGVYAHCSISQTRFDGLVTTLYLFFRSIGLTHAQAHQNARQTVDVDAPEQLPAGSGRLFLRLPSNLADRIPPNAHAAAPTPPP